MSRRCDAGTATVVVVALCAVVVVLVGVLGLLGRVAWAQSRAASAADLAALAAADANRGLSEEDPCELAAQVAKRNGARATRCIARPDLGTVRVDVSFDPGKPLKAVRATAVAGDPER